MPQIDKPKILDLVTRAAAAAYIDGTEKRQITSLLEFFYTVNKKYSNSVDVYAVLVAYLARQSARNGHKRQKAKSEKQKQLFSKTAASFLVDVLEELGGPDNLDRTMVAFYLGLFRWIYESMKQSDLNKYIDVNNLTFKEFVHMYFDKNDKNNSSL